MTEEKLKNILVKGEGLTVEFKRAKKELPINLFETICAFLNKQGGEIILGITDNKNVEGIAIKNTELFAKQIANLSNNPQKLFPSFLLDPKVIKYKDKFLIYILVPNSSQVHKTANKIFDRSTDGDFVLNTNAQIKQLYTRKSSEYSENKIYPYLYENDFSEGVVDRVRKIIRIYRPNHPWNELTNIEFFKTAGLFRKDLASGEEGFTMSALLLFGKPEIIQSAIPHYKIDALLKIENLDRYDDRDHIRCNLIESYDRLMSFVAKHLPDKFYLENDQRISLRERIFREVIANILIHREYTNAFPTSFIIYKNKVESKNANKPHTWGVLEPGNFTPYPKNPHIAQIFTQMGRSEELGTGVQNVFKYNKIYSKSTNNIFKEEDIFIITVPVKVFEEENVTDNVTNNVTNNVTERMLRTITYVSNNKRITVLELSLKLKISRRTVLRDLEKLKLLKRLKRIGDEKTGHWEVLNN